jgi:CO/xanthine dehydrogenase Mo-binding subunit
MKFALGQAVPRTEDPRLLTGRGRYTDDFVLPRLAHGFVLRSPHAHACIRSMDTRAAQQMPGVLGVMTGEDRAAEKFGARLPSFRGSDATARQSSGRNAPTTSVSSLHRATGARSRRPSPGPTTSAA